MNYDSPEPIQLHPENARGRDWTSEEDAYLRDNGPRATSEATGRTYASCQSRYNRRGYHLEGMDTAEQEDAIQSQERQQPVIVGVKAGEAMDIEDALARHRKHFQRIHKANERKKQQHVYLPGGVSMITFFSDQHIGSPHTDIDRMLAEQRMVMALPNSYVSLGGDTVDNYVIGKLATQNFNHSVLVGEEWQIARFYMDQFQDRLLWVHSGNHAQWSTKLIGVDVDRSITPDGVLYDADEIIVNVHIGPHTYLIKSRHKWSGNSIHNATHGMERSIRFDDPRPDIVIGAHVHKGAIVRNFIHNARRKTAILTGTYKGTSDTYARQEGFAANDGSTGVSIIFFPDGTYHAFDSIPAACHVMRALQRQAA